MGKLSSFKRYFQPSPKLLSRNNKTPRIGIRNLSLFFSKQCYETHSTVNWLIDPHFCSFSSYNDFGAWGVTAKLFRKQAKNGPAISGWTILSSEKPQGKQDVIKMIHNHHKQGPWGRLTGFRVWVLRWRVWVSYCNYVRFELLNQCQARKQSIMVYYIILIHFILVCMCVHVLYVDA